MRSVSLGLRNFLARTLDCVSCFSVVTSDAHVPDELWAAGAFAGVANSFVAGPVEHVRIRE